MRGYYENNLAKKFPKMFKDMYGDMRQTCMTFGIETGEGWYNLLWNLCEDIQKEIDKDPEVKDFYFSQIKEKFGLLRVYYAGGNEAINNLVSAAEEESAKICEECGTRDDVTSEGSWIKTLCKACRVIRDAQKSGQHLMIRGLPEA